MRFAFGVGVVIATAACSPGSGFDDDSIPTDTSEQPALVAGENVAWAFWNDSFGLAYNYNSFNQGTGCASVSQGPTGTYTVTFCGIGAGGGHVQVTAVGTGNQRCKVQSWTTIITDLVIFVRCHSGSALANSAFVVEYTSVPGGQTPSALGAYVLMNQPTGGTLSTSTMWGDSITVIYLGTGHYQLNFANQNMNAGNVQVTAFGTDATHCKVESWGSSQAKVLCYNATANPSDSQFTLRYTLGSLTPDCGFPGIFGPGVHDTKHGSGGYVKWIGSIPSANRFSILQALSGCSETCGQQSTPPTVTSIASGRYKVHYTDFNTTIAFPDMQIPLVTAFGANARYCKVESWKTDASGTDVHVRCYNGQGTSLSNSNFSQLLFSNAYLDC